ncbi:MAG TPA: nitroreductase family deazaflavin-dependent oxidoreductase [Desertimonas sp.]|nr:nitroreductase family deazaflavin-dependent oxidoreductase [Desertimonas sp.]
MERANVMQRITQRVASTRPGAFIFRHTFHHVDRVLYRVLGRRTVSGFLAGVPNIMLTTTGARSGQPRTVPLVGVPVEDGVAIVGTRFGSPHHPAWYHNLLANPHAEMERDGTKSAVVARSVPDGPEYDAVMHAADAVYSGFPIYRRRITARRVPIFVLQPSA